MKRSYLLEIALGLIGLALVLFAIGAKADAVVLSCSSPWGSSGSCGGCDGLVWKTAAPALNVKTTASDFWVKFSSLKPTDTVYTNTTAKDGDAATCATATPITVANIGGSVPIPLPPPSPQLSPCLTTGCQVTWTAPTLNESENKKPGTPIGPILNYLLNVNGAAQNVGNVLAYSLIKPIGDYTITLQTVTADGTSNPTLPVIAHVVGVTVTPPPAVLYHVKPITAGTRPATELVLSADGTAKVLGYKLGDIPVGKPCDHAKQLGTSSNEYHLVSEVDVVLLSPTYKGRQLVSVCGK